MICNKLVAWSEESSAFQRLLHYNVSERMFDLGFTLY